MADLEDVDGRIAEGEQRQSAAETAYSQILGQPADRPAKSLSAANVEIDQAFRSAILERTPPRSRSSPSTPESRPSRALSAVT
jgi:hypothetical protein